MHHRQHHQETPRPECSPLGECRLDVAVVEVQLEGVSTEIQAVEEVCLAATVLGLVLLLKVCLLNHLHRPESNTHPSSLL